MTRLVARWVAAKPLVKNYRRPAHGFARRYTAADVELLAEVDRAMGTLSGPATACVLRCQRDVFKDARFQRLGDISVGHLYNLRNSAPCSASYMNDWNTHILDHLVRGSFKHGVNRGLSEYWMT